MRRFLELLHRDRRPVLLTTAFRDLIGADVFAALVAADVLRPAGLATTYPCPRGGDACPRRIVDNPGDPEHPFVAVPGGGMVCCPAVPLRAEELEQHAVFMAGLVRSIRLLFDICGDFDLDNEVFPCTRRIGTEKRQHGEHGEAREVLLCTWTTHGGFTAFLQARQAMRRPTLVLAPVRAHWLRPGVEENHGPGERVELAFLEDVLGIRDGRPCRLERSLAAREAVVESYGSRPRPFCEVIDGACKRFIGEGEYRDLVAQAGDYDLFLDTMTKAEAGRHPGSRRLGDDAVERVALTNEEAQIVIELVERYAPLRASEIKVLGRFGMPEKRVEAARRAIDIKLGRYQWRAIQTLRGDDREAKRFLFNPPDGFRFAVVRPILATAVTTIAAG
ncbi:MAG: hypothetical protein V2A73_22295 [Pseudomonadota bacterium]